MNQTMQTNPMKSLARILLLAVLLTGLNLDAARAQDDQEYKRAYNAGLEAAQAKNHNEAYQQFTKAVQLARQAGDQDVVKRANKVLTQIDYARGAADLKKEDFSAAIEDFDKGIATDPTYAKNYYGKGLALKNLGQVDNAVATLLKAAEVGSAEGDSKTAQAAHQSIRDHYIFLASSALAGNGNPTSAGARQALEHINALSQHLELDADAYYYMAEARKVLGEYGQAVAAADQALEIHRGSRNDKAKVHYVKGEALMLSGNNDAAKAAFREALFGNFRASAQHYIDTL